MQRNIHSTPPAAFGDQPLRGGFFRIASPVTSLVMALLCAGTASAGVSHDISFQGRLTDDAGIPLVDGSYTLDFFFYDTPTGGDPLGAVLNQTVEISGGDGVVSWPVPVDSDWFAGTPRFLGITVDDIDDDPEGDELAPRIMLTAVPYALRALNLPATTIINVAGGQFTGDVAVEGEVSIDDRVGIGTDAPQSSVDIQNGALRVRGSASLGQGPRLLVDSENSIAQTVMQLRNDNQVLMSVNGAPTTGVPRVGIGTDLPQKSLDIKNGALRIHGTGGLGQGPRFQIDTGPSTAHTLMELRNDNGIQMTVEGDGHLTTKVLTILGGADLAEPFPTSNIEIDAPQPGHVVAIDPSDPGSLTLARSAYDPKVAGIVSGANGLNPGMVMRSEGDLLADGDINLALSGRVWCWCDADDNGVIQPGDMLTTSDVAGHAMKATDRDRAFGSVIGKAMTPLTEGKGLVLVLVNLQ